MTDKLKIIDRYIGTSTLRGFSLAIFLLVAVFSIFELLVQLDSVGRGTYRVADAFIFTALTIPKRLVNLIPMAGLLGGTLATLPLPRSYPPLPRKMIPPRRQ